MQDSKYRVIKPLWEINYQLCLKCENIKILKPLTLFLAFPFSIPFRQKLINLQFNSPATEVTDEFGRPWLSLEVSTDKRFIFK